MTHLHDSQSDPAIRLLLRVGCEGGSLALFRGPIRDWKELPPEALSGIGPKPTEIYWVEQDEAALCDLLGEEGKDYDACVRRRPALSFHEAMRQGMEPWSWWFLQPDTVAPECRETLAAMLEERFPGWRATPEVFREELPSVRCWMDALRPPEPEIILTYVVRPPEGPQRGVRLELGRELPEGGWIWHIPPEGLKGDPADWRPRVPGFPYDGQGDLDHLSKLRLGLPLGREPKRAATERQLTLQGRGWRLRLEGWEALPPELEALTMILETLEAWLPRG